jgi:D-tyrosyl-tRNA(Tyr) deacylase
MRCLVQRVTSASVIVDGNVVGKTDGGLMILACAMDGDTSANVDMMARKLVNMRIFRDDAGKTNRSVLDMGGSVLLVSQFTLAADTSSGNRPGFSSAAHPGVGRELFDLLVEAVKGYGVAVETGVFGAEMKVSIENDGPMTIWIEK